MNKKITMKKISDIVNKANVICNNPAERLVVFFLDHNFNAIKKVLFKGTKYTCKFTMKEIIINAIKCNACYAFFAHNHPGHNDATPSDKDLKITLMARIALASIGVRLVDHVIFSDRNAYFMSISDEWKKQDNLFK